MWRAHMFSAAMYTALGGQYGEKIDFLTDTIKMSLHTNAGGLDPNGSTIFAETGPEITGTGYTAGGKTFTTKAIAWDPDFSLLTFTGSFATGWGQFTTPYYATIYDDTSADKLLIGQFAFNSVIHNTSSNSSDTIYLPTTFTFKIQTFSNSNIRWYGRAWENIFGGSSGAESRCTNWESDTIKMSLHGSAYIPDMTNDEVYADLSDELSGGGYGQITLDNRSLTYDANENPQTTRLMANSAVFPALTTSDAHWAAIWNDTPTDKPLLGLVDLGGVSCGGVDLVINWGFSNAGTAGILLSMKAAF